MQRRSSATPPPHWRALRLQSSGCSRAKPQHARLENDRDHLLLGAGEHPRDQRGDFQSGVRAEVAGQAQPGIDEFPESRFTARASAETSPAADKRFEVWKSCI